ncbi:hypothetical protein D3C86_2160050 [compost metagenome]
MQFSISTKNSPSFNLSRIELKEEPIRKSPHSGSSFNKDHHTRGSVYSGLFEFKINEILDLSRRGFSV